MSHESGQCEKKLPSMWVWKDGADGGERERVWICGRGRCKRKATIGRKFCWQHAQDDDASPEHMRLADKINAAQPSRLPSKGIPLPGSPALSRPHLADEGNTEDKS